MANTGDEIRTKRRRTSADSALHLADLPDSLLANVSKFLYKPSVALFAGALTASSESWRKCDWQRQPLVRSEIVLSLQSKNGLENQWKEVNFGDVDDNLAKMLADDDVEDILV